MKIKLKFILSVLLVSATLAHADFNLDVDADGKTMPLTDGLLVIRHLFGFTGDALVSGAVATDANRKTPDAISEYLNSNAILLDIDADGKATPLTDGLLVIRGLFGFSGTSLSQGAIGSDSLRTDGEGVTTYLTTIIDSDNDGANDAFDDFPSDPSEAVDTDGDLIGNNTDPDDDNDGVADTADAFSLISLGGLTDTDGDGRPNDCDSDCQTLGMTADPDDDNDGVADGSDAYPLNTNVHTAPAGESVSVALNLLPQTSNSVSGTAAGTAQDSRSVTYTLVSSPSHSSSFTLNASTGAYSYTTTETVSRTDTFTYTVNDGFVDSATATVTINLNTDPLYKYQWHLNNTGQTNFATTAASSGEDLNVSSQIVAGRTGTGVLVAVVDDGLELAHEDLAANIVSDGSHDFVGNDSDPTPSSSGGNHGTSVAGIIAAVGWNNKGVRGVAPSASLKGFNYLENQTLANFTSAMGSESYSQDVDVFNGSYGSYRRDFGLLSISEQLAIANLQTLRAGKGAVFVKSAGNNFSKDSDYWAPLSVCGSDASFGFSCHDANLDPTHVRPEVIVVGALAADGSKASYSSVGGSLWVSAPGGEFGANSDHVVASGVNLEPAIMTTDLSTCSKGYVSANESKNYNVFNDYSSPHSENANCDYVSTFNGTSSAAPNVSGVVALMLEAKPSLTWRDVKHILATTAVQKDASNVSTAIGGITYHQWVTNSAGLKFHNYYGFGAVDANAAVDAAAAYSGNLGSLNYASTASGVINGLVSQQVDSFSSVTVATSGTVEFVRVWLDASVPFPTEMGLRLESPSGTVLTILQPYTAVNTGPAGEFWLAASGFYGESYAGDWKLRLYDHENNGTGIYLKDWELQVYYRE